MLVKKDNFCYYLYAGEVSNYIWSCVAASLFKQANSIWSNFVKLYVMNLNVLKKKILNISAFTIESLEYGMEKLFHDLMNFSVLVFMFLY